MKKLHNYFRVMSKMKLILIPKAHVEITVQNIHILKAIVALKICTVANKGDVMVKL